MPWPIAVMLVVGGLALIGKAIVDRRGRYDDPPNTLDDRFEHMIEPTAQRDRYLQDRRR